MLQSEWLMYSNLLTDSALQKNKFKGSKNHSTIVEVAVSVPFLVFYSNVKPFQIATLYSARISPNLHRMIYLGSVNALSKFD